MTVVLYFTTEDTEELLGIKLRLLVRRRTGVFPSFILCGNPFFSA